MPTQRRSAVKAAPVKAAPVKKAPATAVTKPPKEKPVRDGFTMPAAEYAVIGAIKQRAIRLGHPAKKSEVLRAGLKTLAAMADAALLAALKAVPPLKTGRPKAKQAEAHAKAAQPKPKARSKKA